MDGFALEIQKSVKRAVEGMTGLKVVEVNVHIQGVNTEINNENDNTTSTENKE